MIIDAHLHLWKKQDGLVDGRKVIPLKNGRSDFGGEIRREESQLLRKNLWAVFRKAAELPLLMSLILEKSVLKEDLISLKDRAMIL